ncbi:BlaI/MecI/CopY family transcriptional regulator [Streptomyces avidinii]|uniref:BlaI/MecI/CopY family transcriptional regulator n=1 Tax=Streptomyces TaxID=1883 RepID=UPI00349F2FA5
MEASVLAALGRAPEPVPATWVRREVDPALAYTTVVTALARLEAKAAVARRRVGRLYLWRALVDETGLAALRMRQVLDGESDREAVLGRFVAGLPARDEQALRDRLGHRGSAAEPRVAASSQYDEPRRNGRTIHGQEAPG